MHTYTVTHILFLTLSLPTIVHDLAVSNETYYSIKRDLL